MSQSSSLLPSTHSSKSLSTMPHSPVIYRQSEYRSGQIVRIHESRRGRKPKVHEDSNTCRRQQQQEPQNSLARANKDNIVSNRIAMSYRRQKDVEHTVGDLRSSHVTLANSPRGSSRKMNTGIIHPDTSYQSQPTVQSKDYGILTPPPTPRLRRLPTPELPDLLDTPFCSCCPEPLQRRHCSSCTCEDTCRRP